MGKDWVYARIVKEMSENGGPDAWLDIVKKSEYDKGASDMKNKLVAPLIMAGIAIGVIGIIGCQEINRWIDEKKKSKLITEQEATLAEEYLKKELYTALEEVSKSEEA